MTDKRFYCKNGPVPTKKRLTIGAAGLTGQWTLVVAAIWAYWAARKRGGIAVPGFLAEVSEVSFSEEVYLDLVDDD